MINDTTSLKFFALCFCLLFLNIANPALSARPDGLNEEDQSSTQKNNRHKSGASVQTVQEALANMGFYLGSIDGHLNDETSAAIRVYQKTTGLKVDGRITRQLWDILNNVHQVRGLLKRLDTARKHGKDKARAALLAHSATKDLVKDLSGIRADPTRKPDACFKTPTVRCLLFEAQESVKAVHKPELRDWALGEVLIAQARAGLGELAMQTAARILDPRLIMVALRDIAEAQAATGNSEQAMNAARIIPDVEKRAKALTKIVQIHAQLGDKLSTQSTADVLVKMLVALQSEQQQIFLKTQIAIAFNQVGSPLRTRNLLAETENQSRQLENKNQRDLGLRHVATAYARLKKLKKAQALLSEITKKAEREPILIHLASAMAATGRFKDALEIAKQITPRYRAAPLGAIALAQARSDTNANTGKTLQLAKKSIEEINLPYARSFAQSQLAVTMAQISNMRAKKNKTNGTSFLNASKMAAQIKDNRLRAYTLWSIAYEQRKSGDHQAANTMETLANTATSAIKSRLSQVWMFTDLAAQHVRRGDAKLGWVLFNRGLNVGQSINNAWARARALAKLAQTLLELAAPGKGRIDAPSSGKIRGKNTIAN